MLTPVKSKRDSSAACPGASRKGKRAGHCARNDAAFNSPAPAVGVWELAELHMRSAREDEASGEQVAEHVCRA
jgi:hypothetical protein